ncbi:MAG: SIR2 family protein [Candidatus Bathyarchaeota archaeon]|nr:SIR2 family protein [Candidatus Bathyarchaeum sp.]
MRKVDADDRLRVTHNAFPNIFTEVGQETFPLRCPACNADHYLGINEFVDETNSFAVFPDKINYHYQRYVSMVCMECGYRYHIRPTGKWSTTNYLIQLDTSKMYLVKKKVIIDEKTRLPIGKWQDYRILELAKNKRYSNSELNKKIITSKIVILTGAGFSAPLGMPTTREFKKMFSPQLISKFYEWLGPFYCTVSQMLQDKYLTEDIFDKKGNPKSEETTDILDEIYQRMIKRRKNVDKILGDIEILMDTLFRIQRVAATTPEKEKFLDNIRQLSQKNESVFIFREELFKNGWYPPISQAYIHSAFSENLATNHFTIIRAMIREATSSILKSCLHQAKEKQQISTNFHKVLLDELLKINSGPMPIFTTNYDMCIEDIYNSNNQSSRLITGTTNLVGPKLKFEIDDPTDKDKIITLSSPCPTKQVTQNAYLKTENDSIALFHLHGCSSWLIDTTNGITLQINENDDLETIIKLVWLSARPFIPGIIFPSTVKDTYTISPPFNIAYDYFSQTLREAKVLVIIGYSGRDETLKEIINWSSKKNQSLQFIVVGKGKEVPCHLKDVIPENRLFYLSNGICENVETVVHMCNNIVSASQ